MKYKIYKNLHNIIGKFEENKRLMDVLKNKFTFYNRGHGECVSHLRGSRKKIYTRIRKIIYRHAGSFL